MRPKKMYDVVLIRNGERIAYGTSRECAAAIGVTIKSFYKLITDCNNGVFGKYAIKASDESFKLNRNCRFAGRSKCSILVDGSLCEGCSFFKPSLRAMKEASERRVCSDPYKEYSVRKMLRIDGIALYMELERRGMKMAQLATKMKVSDYTVRSAMSGRCSEKTFAKMKDVLGADFIESIKKEDEA